MHLNTRTKPSARCGRDGMCAQRADQHTHSSRHIFTRGKATLEHLPAVLYICHLPLKDGVKLYDHVIRLATNHFIILFVSYAVVSISRIILCNSTFFAFCRRFFSPASHRWQN